MDTLKCMMNRGHYRCYIIASQDSLVHKNAPHRYPYANAAMCSFNFDEAVKRCQVRLLQGYYYFFLTKKCFQAFSPKTIFI